VRARVAGAALLATIAASGCGGDDEIRGPDPFTKVEQNERARDARAKATVAPRWAAWMEALPVPAATSRTRWSPPT